jgi:hypothetical protein
MSMNPSDKRMVFDHYKRITTEDNEIDEGDLVIFRLLGARFDYSEVEFNQRDEQVEFDAS